MRLQIELTPELEAQLKVKSLERGQSLESLALEVLQREVGKLAKADSAATQLALDRDEAAAQALQRRTRANAIRGFGVLPERDKTIERYVDANGKGMFGHRQFQDRRAEERRTQDRRVQNLPVEVERRSQDRRALRTL